MVVRMSGDIVDRINGVDGSMVLYNVHQTKSVIIDVKEMYDHDKIFVNLKRS
jgi:hypothetical protein